MRLSPIHHTFAPHVDGKYFLRSCAINCVPWRLRKGKSIQLFRNELEKRFDRSCTLFATGREALVALLRSIDLKAGEEVIVQGYTCVVVPNAIHAAGGSPVYADIDPETLNLDIDEVRKVITPRTRAIICQHTFGIPSDTESLRKICDEKNILLIEDCAHILPDENGPKEIGKFGDVMLLSFGRDKAISGVSGGAVLTRNTTIQMKLSQEESNASRVGIFTLVQWMNYVQCYYLERPLFGIGIGKLLLKLSRILHLMSPVVTKGEKNGAMSPIVRKLPNMCAYFALPELKNLKQINDQRRSLTKFYLDACVSLNISPLKGVTSNLPLQKFPLFVHDASGMRKKLKRENIHLDDGWTGCVVCPASSSLESVNYTEGSDPEAEKASTMILSLPTHKTMTITQAKWLLEALKKHYTPHDAH